MSYGTEQTRRCPLCGDPYKVYMFYAGDQSACCECIAKAERKVRGQNKDSEKIARDAP